MESNSLESLFRTLIYITTSSSIVGASLMLYFCLRKRPIITSIKLISTLAVSDILYSLSNGLSFFKYNEDSVICQIQGNTDTFFLIFSIFITTSIAVLHYKFALCSPNFNQLKFLVMTIVIGICTSLFFSLRSLYVQNVRVLQVHNSFCIQDYYGQDKAEFGERFAYFLFLDAPVFAGPIISLIFYILAVNRVSRTSTFLLGEESRLEPLKLFWFPAAFFITQLPQVVLTFIKYCTDDQDIPLFLSLTNFVLIRSMGLVNAVTYGIQRKIYWSKRKDVRNLLLKDGNESQRVKTLLEFSSQETSFEGVV